MNNNKNIFRSAASGMNKALIRPTTNGIKTAANGTANGIKTAANGTANGIKTAANGMNKTIIQPTANGINTAGREMDKVIIRPTTNGIKTVATEVNKTIIRPAVDPFNAKLRSLVVFFKKPSDTVPPKPTDDESTGSTDDADSQAHLSDVEEEPEPEPIPESAFQDLIVDNDVDSKALSSALDKMYMDYIERAYDERHEQEGIDEHQFAVGTIVDASFLLVNEFALMETNKDVLEKIQHAIADYLFRRISPLCTDVSNLRAELVAKLISFADLYKNTMTEKGLVVPKQQLAEFEGLETEYLRRAVHDNMKRMVNRSLELCKQDEGQLRENGDGNIVTGNPDDVSYMIAQQLEIADELLPPRFMSCVLAACNHELENMVGDLMLDVGSNWKERNIEELCASVNDTVLLIQQCDDLNDKYLDKANDAHVQAGDDLLIALTELSLHALTFVCERVMLDVREPDLLPLSLEQVGSEAWEEDLDSILIRSTIMTLDDYFGDIHSCIPEGYYFPKVVKNCFDMTLETYLHSFFANSLSPKGSKDPLIISQRLLQDWQVLHDFFCLREEQTDFLGHAGHYTKEEATRRLQVIQALSFLVTPNMAPDKLDEQVKSLLHLFGCEKGTTAILHIAGLRNRELTSKEAAEWHEVLKEEVQQFLVDSEASKASPVFTLPDLRNSEHLARVRAVNENLDDSLRAAGVDTLPPRKPNRRTRLRNIRAYAGRRFMRDRTLLSTWKDKEEDDDSVVQAESQNDSLRVSQKTPSL